MNAVEAYEAYQIRLRQMQELKVAKVEDCSDLAVFTRYEEQLYIRNVHLVEYESRLKQFVYKVSPDERKSLPDETCTIKLKQLQVAFKGNAYLEAMINDKKSLDWRMLMQDNIFRYIKDDEDQNRKNESIEEDPELVFRVDELNLLGMLYCKCEPDVRAEHFYTFLQPGLDEQISCTDRDLEVFVPIMGRICYEAVINCFNQEHESQGSDQACPELIPSDNLEALDEACKNVFEDQDIGFVEKVFEFQTRITQATFIQKLSKQNYNFLQPHNIRLMVSQQLTEKLANLTEEY